MFSRKDYINEIQEENTDSESDDEEQQKAMLEDVGPIEIEEPYNIMWNANDWPVYIKCPFSSDTHNLMAIIQEGWLLRRPQIILCVISQFGPLSWNNETQIARFRKGLIKAASAAKMWITTNGLDVGASKMIAEAIETQKKWTKATSRTTPLLQAKCIGVVREDRMTSDPLIQRNLKDIEKLQETNPLRGRKEKHKEDKFYIHSDHTHFIFVTKGKDSDLEQLLSLELFSELSKEVSWLKPSVIEAIENRKTIGRLQVSKTPMIALVIEGDVDSATIVLQYLYKQIPIVVLNGKGGFAELLSYAYTEISEMTASLGYWDKEFVEEVLKPTLGVRITQMFPQFQDKHYEVRSFTNKIVECVRQSSQDGVEYLTILNIFSSNVDLRNLDSYLLEAHFKTCQVLESSIFSATPQEQFVEDLNLTLSWNNHTIAKNLVQKRMKTQRVTVTKELFARALIESGREEFINLFLESGFHVRQLYNYGTVKWLIKEALKVEFFVDVCCEGILSGPSRSFPFDYFLSYLNRLIFMATGLGDFIKHDDLTQRFQSRPNCVEQKALAFITIWAVFTNNMKIVSKLWPHHNQPINICLIVSSMLKKMAKYVSDISLNQQMLKMSVEYGHIATEILDEIYEFSPSRAVELATVQSPHFSYQSAIDVAADIEVYEFVSHPSCQRYLTNLYYNGMHLKQSPYGEFMIPSGAKIILCAFLVFPIYLWLDFPEYVKQKEIALQRYKEEREAEMQNDLLTRIKDYGTSRVTGVTNVATEVSSSAKVLLPVELSASDISLFQKIVILWTAPMTKYWLYHIFYLMFVLTFAIDVLTPSCGYIELDTIVFVWIASMLAEDIRMTFILLRKFVSFRLTMKYIEISATIIFLCIFYLGRIIKFVPVARYQYRIRMLMCCALFHYHIRYLAMFLPISSLFGPLFYKLKRMVYEDLGRYLFISAPFMIGGGVVIYVAHFPDRDLLETSILHIIFHKVFFSLFRTYDDFMFENPSCADKRTEPFRNTTFCRASVYSDPTCNRSGIWPYIFNIMFLIMLRNVLTTLLEALVSTTMSQLDTATIWKFQRFYTITEYEMLSPLPPPFNALYYIYRLLKYCCLCFCCVRKEEDETVSITACHRCPDATLIYFMKVICEKVVNKANEKSKLEDVIYKLSNQTTESIQQIDYTKVQVHKLRRKITSLHGMIKSLQVDVEAAKHKFHKLDKKEVVHQLLSRTTPYPQTTVERNPVSDKNVSWDVVWVDYDPLVFTQPKQSFPPELNPDDDTTADILDDTHDKTPQLKPQFKFNNEFVDGLHKYDRRTWINDERNNPIDYRMDGISPLNPYGRTGLAGRGALPRWGPNHHIAVLITKYSTSTTGALDAILRPKSILDTADYNLIGGFIPNENVYDIIKRQVDPQSETEWKTHEDMIEFFTEQVETDKVTVERKIIEKKKTEVKQETNVVKGFVPAIDFELETDEIFKPGMQKIGKMIDKKGLQYRKVFAGYLDSPLNTDNAWKEVEFWHFHYTTEYTLKATNDLNWITVKENIKEKLSPDEYNLILNCIPYLKKIDSLTN